MPFKPDRPEAKWDRGDGIHVIVKWTSPKDDGGGDITAFVVKYGDERTSVDHYATVKVAGNTTGFKFTDQLTWGTKYHFAVAAENTAGRGEFSEFSDFVRISYGT